MGSPAAAPEPFRWGRLVLASSKAGHVPTSHVITTAASVRLCHHLRLLLLRSSLQMGWYGSDPTHQWDHWKKLSRLCEVPGLKSSRCETAFRLNRGDLIRFMENAFLPSGTLSLCSFDGVGGNEDSRNEEGSNTASSRRNSFDRRRWTNVLLAVNVLAYIAQIATQGKLMLWGAKVNSLIDKGQVWRLATASVLHANVAHLMINCYSLNSVGPTMENICGPKRFLAVYLTSAVASSAMSYWFNKAPAVGASGAIFGLVGSVAVFVLRHRGMVRGANDDLQQIAQVIFLNMAMGVLSKGIDNWGHIGGLLGGAATSWLLGPAWKYESTSIGGRRIFTDQAPIFYVINRRKENKKLD